MSDGRRITGITGDTPNVRPQIQSEVGLLRAERLLDRTAADFKSMPWASLHAIVGGIPPEDVWYVVMASNNGKTLFVRSLVEALLARGDKVFLMSTETKESYFRLAMAVQDCGYYPGDFATGRYLLWPNAEEAKARVKARFQELRKDKEFLGQLQIWDGGGLLSAPQIAAAASRAEDIGADWFVVDHVDHVDSRGHSGELGQSTQVNAALKEEAAARGMRVIGTSQLNQTPFKELGKMAMCSPPMEDWVRFGGGKKQVATGMIGGFRPLRSPLPSDDTLKAFRAGEIPISDVTIPNAMRIVSMKNREHGNLVGQKCTLDIFDGRLVEPGPRETGALIHGIRSTPRSIG